MFRMNRPLQEIACVIFTAMASLPLVSAHGYMIEPPARSSLWTLGYNTPANYDHNGLNCGGLPHFTQLKGKCGLCGDPYDGPRENEAGGKFATGIITRTYEQGETIQVVVKLTATHGGYFEFKLCANNDIHKPITQDCLDKHLLTREDIPGQTRYSGIPEGEYVNGVPRSYIARISYKLPANVTCDQCVLQWRYITAHNPGSTYQEEFYGCSDIAIYPAGVSIAVTGSRVTTTTTATPRPTTTTKRTTTVPTITTTTKRPTTVTTKQPTTTTTKRPTTTTTTKRPTTTTTTKRPTTATTKSPATTTTKRPGSLKTPSASPTTTTRALPTTGQSTTTGAALLSFDELYQRCHGKGVLRETFTTTCRELCVQPSGCPETFCNTYCVLLANAAS